MIAVPDAAVLPSQPRPVRFENSSSSAFGNPRGYVRNARSSSTPQISQCPVVLSLPCEAGSATPYAAVGFTSADRPGHVAEGVAPFVAVRRLVGSGADAEPVEDDDRGAPLHSYTRVKRLPRPVRNSRCSSPLHAAN